MRNAFVVLVSCIGLASGFIVPSSVPELTTKKSSLTFDNSKDINVETTTLPTKLAILPSSRSDIDEKDLYEHATEKSNNQNERSFIYINQKYKKPTRNKYIKLIPKDLSDFVSPMPVANGIENPSSIFNSGPNLNSNFQEFLDDNKQQDMSSYFPILYGCKLNDLSNKIDNANAKIQVTAPNKVDVRRDYFELLKPPILRSTLTRIRSKVKYDNMNHDSDLSALSPSHVPYRENYVKKYNLKSQYSKAAVSAQNEMRKKYGFDVTFVRHPAFDVKGAGKGAEDATFEGDFDYDYRRPWENHEEDKLLAKYLKDTLEEREVAMVNDNDKSNMNLNNQEIDCAKQDCTVQTRSRNYINNGLKPDCPCKTRDTPTTNTP